MSEFRRNTSGIAITGATLHAGNTGIIFYFKADDSGKDAITCTSTDAAAVEVEAVKMNDAKQGLRQVRLAAKKAGSAIVTAFDGGTSLADLPITVKDKLALPDKNTNAGMLARLLIAESRSPYQSGYIEADSKTGMDWMLLVLQNRLYNKPELFGAKGATTLTEIVTAKGQFAGFENYPNIEGGVESNVNNAVDIANDDNHGKQPLFIAFVKNALDVAAKTTAVADPVSPDILAFWRTAGSGSPGGSAVLHASLSGNTFYKMPKP